LFIAPKPTFAAMGGRPALVGCPMGLAYLGDSFL